MTTPSKAAMRAAKRLFLTQLGQERSAAIIDDEFAPVVTALQDLVAKIEAWEAAVREVIHCDPKHGMDLTAAKAALKEWEAA